MVEGDNVLNTYLIITSGHVSKDENNGWNFFNI